MKVNIIHQIGDPVIQGHPHDTALTRFATYHTLIYLMLLFALASSRAYYTPPPPLPVLQIRMLEELSLMGFTQFPWVLAASLEATYQYSAVSIKGTLNNVEQDILMATRSFLYDLLVMIFPQYRGMRMTVCHVKT